MSARGQHGVSLIELMVALLVGSLLMIGLVQVFSASRTAYQLSTGLARTQENGRFAMDMLQRDLRVAGHFGCVNDQARFLPGNVTPSRPALVSTFMTADAQVAGNYAAVTEPALRFDVPIMGYNAIGTSPGATLTLPSVPSVAVAGTAWQPAIPEAIFARMTALPVAGSDVLVLRHFHPAGAQIDSVTPGETTEIDFVDDHVGRLTEGVTEPSMFGIADCMTAAVFGASGANLSSGSLSVAAGGGNVRGLAEQAFVDGQAMLYRAESLVYYVGVNGQGNPALYRLRHALSDGDVTAAPEELVEGIDSLQLVFGQDSNVDAASVPTGNIGISATADAIGDDDAWRRVGLVQLGVVARSIDPAAAAQRNVSDAVPPLSLLGLTIAPPADAHYRATYEDAVALRNRLFGN